MSDSTQYSSLTDDELLNLHAQTVKSVTKWSNFQMVRKICLLQNQLSGTTCHIKVLDDVLVILARKAF